MTSCIRFLVRPFLEGCFYDGREFRKNGVRQLLILLLWSITRVVDFLLVIIELLSLGVTAEALRAKIGDFAPTRSL